MKQISGGKENLENDLFVNRILQLWEPEMVSQAINFFGSLKLSIKLFQNFEINPQDIIQAKTALSRLDALMEVKLRYPTDLEIFEVLRTVLEDFREYNIRTGYSYPDIIED